VCSGAPRGRLDDADFANLTSSPPQLAVGGDLSSIDDALAGQQFAEIVELGITHIVDVRLEWSDLDTFAERAPDIGYLHHGMDDAGQAVPAAWFEQAVSWIEAAYAENPDAVVLTHCHMGINRGPSLGFAVLLAQGWDPVEAIAAIRAARPAGQRLVRRRRPRLVPRPHRRGCRDGSRAARRAGGVAGRELARRRTGDPRAARDGLLRGLRNLLRCSCVSACGIHRRPERTADMHARTRTTTTTLLTAALILTPYAAGPAHAAPPTAPAFVFTSDRDGDTELYLRAGDGSTRQLTSNTADDYARSGRRTAAGWPSSATATGIRRSSS
jgi:hypothetical protein